MKNMHEGNDSKAETYADEIMKYFPKLPLSIQLYYSAKIGASFNNKDYDGFLKWAREYDHKYPGTYLGVAQIASALACKYVVTRNTRYKVLSLDQLNESKKLAKAANAEKEFKEYEERILHRLRQREIITGKEYNRRFRRTKKGSN